LNFVRRIIIVLTHREVWSNLIEAIVSVKRLSFFLNADELQYDARQPIEKPPLNEGDEVLSISQAGFSWAKLATTPILEDVNLTVKKGKLVGTLGRVGAGKNEFVVGYYWRTLGLSWPPFTRMSWNSTRLSITWSSRHACLAQILIHCHKET